jgi:acyl-CoA synthetase (AMP-forming)/AMP-acid ligase II
MLLPKLVAMASSHPDEYAFVIGDQALSWAVVLAKVESMLEQVKKFEGSRILVMIDDSAVDSLSLMLACSATKCESILLSSFHSVERARVLAAEFDADFLLQALNSKIVVELERKRDRGPSEFTQPMLGLLTSGTSGTPKCARYDWSRISAAVVKNEKFKGR